MPLPVSSKCWLVAISIFNDLITNQLLNDLLNELSEAVRRMLTVQMFDKFSYDFSVGFRFELVPLVFQKFLDVLVIGNNSCKWKSCKKWSRWRRENIFVILMDREKGRTVVDNNELVIFIRTMRMRVYGVGNTMSSPTCVSNTNMNVVDSVNIQLGFAWQ